MLEIISSLYWWKLNGRSLLINPGIANVVQCLHPQLVTKHVCMGRVSMGSKIAKDAGRMIFLRRGHQQTTSPHHHEVLKPPSWFWLTKNIVIARVRVIMIWKPFSQSFKSPRSLFKLHFVNDRYKVETEIKLCVRGLFNNQLFFCSPVFVA